MSINALAPILGVQRGTLARWIESECCPTSGRGEGATAAWELDPPAVIAWMIEREATRQINKAMGSTGAAIDGEILDAPPPTWTKDEALRRKAISDALIRQIQLDQEARSVVPVSHIADVVSREYATVRENILGIGPRVAPRLVGQKDAAVIADLVRSAIDEALHNLEADSKWAGK